MCNRMKLDSYFTPSKNINSKWIKSLNVKAKNIKILDKNIGVNFMTLH